MEDKFNPDCSRLQQFLPPEVWNLVAADKLKSDPADLEDLVNSSTFFRDLLASQRTLFLFERVFPLVASSVWKKDGLEGLTVSDVLNLRGVCSHWSTVVDKLIYEEFQFLMEGSKSNDTQMTSVASAFSSITTTYQFTPLKNSDEGIKESVHGFLRHFEGTHPGNQPNGRNPFIWGDVYVDTSHDREEDEAYQRFLEGITVMLSKYGSHHHSFYFYCKGDEFVEDFLRFVRDCFLHMPNLKELDFSSYVNGWWRQVLPTNWEFPEFKFLEKLVTDDLPGPLFNPLIRRNNHVSTLVVGPVQEDFDFFTFPLPNLKMLHVGQCDERDVEKFRSPQVQWGLESLRLQFINRDAGVAMPFQVIQEKFASTLRVLYFELKMKENKNGDNGQLWLDCQKCRLVLPNLKEIKLFMKRNPVCLDFLLGMKQNLEEISVTIKYGLPFRQDGTLTSGTIVQFMGFEGKMLESNIWILFKKFKKVEVKAKWDGEGHLESRFYSRDEWMLGTEYVGSDKIRGERETMIENQFGVKFNKSNIKFVMYLQDNKYLCLRHSS